MPQSNKPIHTKNPTNPKNFANLEGKLANLKIPATKHKKPNKFGSQKHTKKKKKKPNPTDCGFVTA